METAIETPVQGKAKILNFLIARTAAIPDDVRDKLQELATSEPSPVVACREAMELIYARADDLPPELLAIGAELGAMMENWSMVEPGRGYGIGKALKERPGVKPEIPAAAKTGPAPKALERFKAEETVDPEAPAEPMAPADPAPQA